MSYKYESDFDYYNDLNPDCRECEDLKKDHKQTIAQAAEYLQDIIKYAYGQQRLDKQDLHLCFVELSYALGIDAPKGEIKLQSSEKPTLSFLNEWVELNNNYIKQ